MGTQGLRYTYSGHILTVLSLFGAPIRVRVNMCNLSGAAKEWSWALSALRAFVEGRCSAPSQEHGHGLLVCIQRALFQSSFALEMGKGRPVIWLRVLHGRPCLQDVAEISGSFLPAKLRRDVGQRAVGGSVSPMGPLGASIPMFQRGLPEGAWERAS